MKVKLNAENRLQKSSDRLCLENIEEKRSSRVKRARATERQRTTSTTLFILTEEHVCRPVTWNLFSFGFLQWDRTSCKWRFTLMCFNLFDLCLMLVFRVFSMGFASDSLCLLTWGKSNFISIYLYSAFHNKFFQNKEKRLRKHLLSKPKLKKWPGKWVLLYVKKKKVLHIPLCVYLLIITVVRKSFKLLIRV